MEKGGRNITIATVNVERLLKDKIFGINQLCAQTGFHIVVLTETKEVAGEGGKLQRFGVWDPLGGEPGEQGNKQSMCLLE